MCRQLGGHEHSLLLIIKPATIQSQQHGMSFSDPHFRVMCVSSLRARNNKQHMAAGRPLIFLLAKANRHGIGIESIRYCNDHP